MNNKSFTKETLLEEAFDKSGNDEIDQGLDINSKVIVRRVKGFINDQLGYGTPHTIETFLKALRQAMTDKEEISAEGIRDYLEKDYYTSVNKIGAKTARFIVGKLVTYGHHLLLETFSDRWTDDPKPKPDKMIVSTVTLGELLEVAREAVREDPNQRERLSASILSALDYPNNPSLALNLTIRDEEILKNIYKENPQFHQR